MVERRKFIRVPISSEISYEISNNPKSHSSVIRNISRAGASFYTQDFIPSGTILKVRFSLDEFSYNGFAKIVWVKQDSENKYEVGVSFISDPRVS
jgi:c-di-GMP-binding flagellar brake protein YcgR